MMDKKIMVIIGVAVAIAVIGGVVFAMSGGDDSPTSDVTSTLDAVIYEAESIPIENGKIGTASEGKKLIVAETTLTNNSKKDMSNNSWFVKLGSERYSTHTYTFDYVGNGSYGYSPTNIPSGTSLKTVYIFEIPKDISLDGLEIQHVGNWGLKCTTKYVQTEIGPMGNFEATISTADSVTLKDGTVYNAEPNMTLMLVKIKLTCNHGKISTRWTNYDVAVSGNAIWMIGSSSQLIEDPYVEVTLNKGESKVTTQMFSIPKVADLHKVTIEWRSTSSDVQGTVIVA